MVAKMSNPEETCQYPLLLPRRIQTQGLSARKKEKHKAEPQVLHIRYHPAITHYQNKPTARKHADNLGLVSKARRLSKSQTPNKPCTSKPSLHHSPPLSCPNSLPLPPTPLNSPHPLQQPQIPPPPHRGPPPPILLPRRRRRQTLQTKNNPPHRPRTCRPGTILFRVHNTPRNADSNGQADRHGLSLHHHDCFFCAGFGAAVPSSTGTGEEEP